MSTAKATKADDETEPPKPPPEARPVDFHGRVVAVKRPTPEQVAVWQRIAKRLNAVGDVTTNEAAMRLLDSTLRLVESVLADPADMEWLEDQLLAGLLTLELAVGILGRTADVWRDDPATAPRTGPAPKARRR